MGTKLLEQKHLLDWENLLNEKTTQSVACYEN